MNILNFGTKTTEIPEEFKTKNNIFVFYRYSKEYHSLIQNLLFRLETTEVENKILFVNIPDDEFKELKEVIFEYTGFFKTEILVSTEIPTTLLKNDYNFIYLLDNIKKNVKSSTIFKLFRFNYDLGISQICLFLNYSAENSSVKITISKPILNTFLNTIYLPNSPLGKDFIEQDYFNVKDFINLNYPLILSKLFNIYNQIISPDMNFYQTIEEFNVQTITSKNSYEYSDLTLVDKYIPIELQEKLTKNLNTEIVQPELNPFSIMQEEISMELFKNITPSTQTINSTKVFLESYLNSMEIKIQENENQIKILSLNKQHFVKEINELNNEVSKINNGKIIVRNILTTLKEKNKEELTKEDCLLLVNIANTLKDC